LLVLTLLGVVAAHADEVDDFVQAEMKKQRIPGLSLAIVKNGKLEEAAGYGLAADAVGKINGTCGGNEAGREFVHANMPQHRGARGKVPAGGNEVFADGSAQWYKFEQMYFLTTWGLSSRVYYFYREPSDFPAALKVRLTSLAARP
jgi:hypothetical protein